jgi:pyrroloquinoline quinone (PQQ) biosynthesis protein C
MKIVEVAEIVASATPAELLAEDRDAPHMRIADHPAWRAALAGEMPVDRLRGLVRRVYPVVAGPGRYAFIAKIGVIDRDDGTRLFDRLYRVTHDADSDADIGWRRVGEALGIAGDDMAAALDDPSPEARDLVDMIRLHGEQSGAAQAAGVAWVLERQMPTLMGALADALTEHYGVPEDALRYLRAEAARADEVAGWVDHLIDKYFMTADAYTVFEARRAMREIGWGWTALTEAEAG